MTVGDLIELLIQVPDKATTVRVFCKGEELPLRSGAPIVTYEFSGAYVAIHVTEHPQREGK